MLKAFYLDAYTYIFFMKRLTDSKTLLLLKSRLCVMKTVRVLRLYSVREVSVSERLSIMRRIISAAYSS